MRAGGETYSPHWSANGDSHACRRRREPADNGQHRSSAYSLRNFFAVKASMATRMRMGITGVLDHTT